MRSHHDIQLQSKGKLARMEWDSETGLYVERHLANDEIPFHIHSSICFADGVTLRDLMMLIARDKDLFTQITTCDCLDDLLNELDVDNGARKDLSALEIAWSVELVEAGNITLFDNSIEFYGCGKERFALEFTPTGHIADIPILLNEAFNVHDKLDKIVLPATRHFTLEEVICSVIGELTFIGSPQERDEVLSDLHNRLDEEEDGVSIEEITEHMEQRTKEGQEKFPCSLCGADNRCACFGKPADLCHDCFKKMEQN